VGIVVGATSPAPRTVGGGSELDLHGRAQHPGIGLPADEVHIWIASLDVSPARRDELERLLSDDERERARRFRFDRDRHRYIAGRGQLREALSRYVGEQPAGLRFRYGPHDKPYLVGDGPHFNLSHSGPVMLLALSSAAEVGIDVELDVQDLARERIAERFFSPGEVRALRALPAALQARAFLHCWTRKEAFIKARGDGLSLALDSFDVTLAPGKPTRLVRTAWSREEPEEWQFADLSDQEHGFIAAVACRSKGWRAVARRIDELVEDEPSNKENR
jgi:4'-phosphopantetheinyl transferase